MKTISFFSRIFVFWQKKRTKALRTTVRRKAGRNLNKWTWLKFGWEHSPCWSALDLKNRVWRTWFQIGFLQATQAVKNQVCRTWFFKLSRDFKSQVQINKGKGYQPSELVNIYFRTLPLTICTWFLQFSSLKYRVWWTGFFS